MQHATLEVLHIVDSRSIAYVASNGEMERNLVQSMEHDIDNLIAEVDTKGVKIEASVSERFGIRFGGYIMDRGGLIWAPCASGDHHDQAPKKKELGHGELAEDSCAC